MDTFTKHDMLVNYRAGIQAVAEELALVVGVGEGTMLSRLQVEPTVDGGSEDAFEAEILKTEAAKLLSEAYDFAFGGAVGERLAYEWEEQEGLTPWVGRFEGLQALVWSEQAGAFNQCVHTLRVAHVRGLFGRGSHTVDPVRGMVWNSMLLQEFALLSGLEEKTLRNMAAASHRQHLPTTKIGKRTYVTQKDALPWLQSRGFAPSVYLNTEAGRDFERRPFLSKEDLLSYVEARQKHLNASTEEIASSVTDIPNFLERLNRLKESGTVEDEAFAVRLATVLGVPNPSGFAAAAIELSGSLDLNVDREPSSQTRMQRKLS